MPLTSLPHRRHVPRVAGMFVALALLAACTSPSPEDGHGPTAAGSGSPSPAQTSPATTPAPTSPASAAPSPSTAPLPVDRAAFTVVGDLDIPWSIAMLPDGAALVSLRNSGDILWVPAPGGETKAHRVGRIAIDRQPGEGGLLGLAVPPDFASDPVFYAYYTSENDNRIAAVPWESGRIGDPKVIFTGIPNGQFHNGGRIAFGPDGYLYVGTGDSGDRSLSQNLSSLGGKILRISTDGKPAPGNPFGGSPIWSYGHRNVQGLAWDSTGRLWESELGQNAWDELNLIRPGKNYGWPDVEGMGNDSSFVNPVAVWRPADLSPSGITVGPDGAVYIAALRGQSVWRVPINADGTAGTPTRHLHGTYGRIRDIRFVDGRAWILTSNGSTDRLVSLPPKDVGASG